MTHSAFRVLLIGRTNVGKSTFFSRVTGHPSLITKEPHTTRDAREGSVSWNKKTFTLVDTGGFDITALDPYHLEVSHAIEQELSRVQLVVVMTDLIDPLPQNERTWITTLVQRNIPVIIAFNKQDKPVMRKRTEHAAFKQVPIFPISSNNGGGVGDLLDAIVERAIEGVTEVQPLFRLGLVGRTNVGKSSLLNALAGEPKAIVSNKHHTTREPLAVRIPYKEYVIEVIDTAGAQKRPKKEMELKTDALTKQMIESCDVVAVVLEYGTHPIPRQDYMLMNTVAAARKSMCIVINKWDLSPERSHAASQQEIKRVQHAFSSFEYAPVLLLSATQRINIQKLLSEAHHIFTERTKELDKKTLRSLVQTLSEHIFHIKQTETDPPHFHAIATSRTIPKAMTDILKKKIREAHPFTGTPLIVSLAKRSRRNESRSRAR